MRNITQVKNQLSKAEKIQVKHSKRLLQLIASRIIVAVLLLALIVGLDATLLVEPSSARSACGVLFVCPTPTPTTISTPISTANPTPVPTTKPAPANPTSKPTSSPTQSSQPSPTATANPDTAPTEAADATPTAVPTDAAAVQAMQTPFPSPTNTPIVPNKYVTSQTTSQSADNGFSRILVIITIVFICLLFALIIGLLLLRRMLLPPIKFKAPASGISSWTRTFVPGSGNSSKRPNVHKAQ